MDSGIEIQKKCNEEIQASRMKGLISVLVGSLFAALLGILLTVIMSLIFAAVGIDDSNVSIAVLSIRAVSTAFFAFIVSRKVKKLGFLWGMLVGILSVFISFLIGRMFYDEIVVGEKITLDMSVCAATGFLAGVIGINTKTKKRH